MESADRSLGARARMARASLRDRLRGWRDEVVARVARTLAMTPRSAALYYLFDRSFQREQQAALLGKWAYRRSLDGGAGSSPLLRRNVHRLEKGLVSRPPRDLFATRFIEETAREFAASLARNGGVVPREGELRWAHDVLSAYFDRVRSDPVVDRARSGFERAVRSATVQERAVAAVPAVRDLGQPPPVTYADFLALSVRRRSVRWFDGRAVPRDLIERAVLAARLAPSACNRLPYRFEVYDDPELLAKVATLPGGTVGFAQNFPCVVVLVGTLGVFASERDRHLVYIDGSLAAMAFMFALETQGLSSCAINWPDLHAKDVALARIIGLAPHERAVMMIAVGYPDPTGLVPSSEKRTVEDLLHFNRLREGT
jgi:nitroreductase